MQLGLGVANIDLTEMHAVRSAFFSCLGLLDVGYLLYFC